MTGAPEALVCDLDGVLYRGDTGIAGSGKALAAISAAGIAVTFVTNNSTKTPAQAADKIHRLTGFAAESHQVVTSAQAAVHLLSESTPPTLLFGAAGARASLEEAGIEVVDDPEHARAVVAGLDLSLSYESLTRAVMAVNRGARFVATNTDVTYPTPEGLWPGAGSLVAAVTAATGVEPEVAGKPHTAMRRLLEDRLNGVRVAVVGDRPETDLALGAVEGWTTILVLTGVTSTAAGVEPAPDHVLDSIADLPALWGI